MGFIDNLNISFSYSSTIFFISLILVFIYTVYIYRTTIPEIRFYIKIILVFLRFTSLVLILLLIFDPTLFISSDVKVEPQTIVLLDNTKSIAEFADSSQTKSVKELSQKLNSSLGPNFHLYTFGNSVKEFEQNIKFNLPLNETATELTDVKKIINEFQEVSSILIVSDGIFNQGTDPTYQLSNLGIPVYTLGIGDSVIYPDVSIERIRNNTTIYTNKESEIEVLLKNNGKSSANTQLRAYDNDNLIYNKTVSLSETGVNRIRFPYITDQEGKHRISIDVEGLPEEINVQNNLKSSVINVLSSKKKIAVISGTPSRDLSSIVKSIKRNNDFELIQITQLGKAGFYDNNKSLDKINEADAIFLVGFPNIYSDPNFVSDIFSVINSFRISVFIAPGFLSDYKSLNNLTQSFGISFGISKDRFRDSQVNAAIALTGILGNSNTVINQWSDLPPVTIPLNNLQINTQLDILMYDEAEQPIILAGSTEGMKIICLNVINFWRWKLMAPENEYLLFDNFIFNSIKWLSLKSDEFFTVKLNKNNFKLGEEIYFKANLYDKTFEPLNNEKISLKIFNDSYSENYVFSQTDNGLYELNLKLSEPGVYNFLASTPNNIHDYKPVTGSFNIDKVELELVERRMNKAFLVKLASSTGGRYYDINKSDNVINELLARYEEKIYYDKRDNELRLSNFELILFIIVLLFAIEWIIRKFMRML